MPLNPDIISVEFNNIRSDFEICDILKYVTYYMSQDHFARIISLVIKPLSLRKVCWQNKPWTYFRIRPNVFQVYFVKTCYRSKNRVVRCVFPMSIWSGKTHPNLTFANFSFCVWPVCIAQKLYARAVSKNVTCKHFLLFEQWISVKIYEKLSKTVQN